MSPAGQLDFDLRGEQRKAVEVAPGWGSPGRRLRWLGEGVADGGGRLRCPTLGKPKERERGLGVVADGMRATEDRFGLREVAAGQADLPDLVEGAADAGRHEALELIGGDARLRLRARPVSPQPLDLRPEEPAHAREPADPLALAPAVLGLGPFRRALPLAQGGT